MCTSEYFVVGELVRRNIYAGKEPFLGAEPSTNVASADTPLDLVLSIIEEAS
jgi:hypothetical protein